MNNVVPTTKSVLIVRIIAVMFVVPSFFASMFYITNLTSLSNFFDLLKFMELSAALLAGYLLWQFSKLGLKLAIILCVLTFIQFLIAILYHVQITLLMYLTIGVNVFIVYYLTREKIAQQFQ